MESTVLFLYHGRNAREKGVLTMDEKKYDEKIDEELETTVETKEENEITVRVQCSKDELKKILNEDKFILNNEYYAKDIFMIPRDIDIFKVATREI